MSAPTDAESERLDRMDAALTRCEEHVRAILEHLANMTPEQLEALRERLAERQAK